MEPVNDQPGKKRMPNWSACRTCCGNCHWLYFDTIALYELIELYTCPIQKVDILNYKLGLKIMKMPVHQQIQNKLKHADEIIEKLQNSEIELTNLKTQYSTAISQSNEKLTEHTSQLTQACTDKITENTGIINAATNTGKESFDAALNTAIENSKVKIEEANTNATSQITTLETNTKQQISESTENLKTLLTEVETLKNNLSEIETILTTGKDPKTGWNTQAENLIASIENFKKLSETSQAKIEEAQSLIFDDTENQKSLLSSVKIATNDIANYKETIYGDENGDIDGKPALQKDIEAKRSEMSRIVEHTTKALKELTDESLDAAFSTISETAKKRGQLALYATVGILVAIVGLSLNLYKDNPTINDFIYRFLLIIPMGFAVFFLNRERKVQHVVEITYRYKSALAKALKGYRNLYNLEHSSDEYMELFNVLKLELLKNPMNDAKPYLDQDMLTFKMKAKGSEINIAPHYNTPKAE